MCENAFFAFLAKAAIRQIVDLQKKCQHFCRWKLFFPPSNPPSAQKLCDLMCLTGLKIKRIRE